MNKRINIEKYYCFNTHNSSYTDPYYLNKYLKTEFVLRNN